MDRFKAEMEEQRKQIAATFSSFVSNTQPAEDALRVRSDIFEHQGIWQGHDEKESALRVCRSSLHLYASYALVAQEIERLKQENAAHLAALESAFAAAGRRPWRAPPESAPTTSSSCSFLSSPA